MVNQGRLAVIPAATFLCSAGSTGARLSTRWLVPSLLRNEQPLGTREIEVAALSDVSTDAQKETVVRTDHEIPGSARRNSEVEAASASAIAGLRFCFADEFDT